MSTDRGERSRRRRQARQAAEAEAPNPLREEGVENDGSTPITEHKNEMLRESIVKGQTLLQMLDDDLEAAWEAYLEFKVGSTGENHKTHVVRGRIRGLAQAITTIRSPFSRQNMGSNSKEWAAAIKATEDESLARVRAKARKNG